MSSLHYTKKIIDTLESTPNCKLLIVPDDLLQSSLSAMGECDDGKDIVQHMIIIEEEGKKELIIDKSMIKLVFKECCPVIKDQLTSNNEDFMFLATKGIMLILNEHITVINRHQDILLSKLHGNTEESTAILRHEINLLRSLLTSNNPKINKSSSLWTLFKKLYTHILSLDPSNQPRITANINELFISTVLQSAKSHTNNYYAWLAMKFLIQVTQIMKDLETLQTIKDTIWRYTQHHINESAAWDCFVSSYIFNIDSMNCVVEECLNWEPGCSLTRRTELAVISDEILDKAYQQCSGLKQWILKSQISTSVVPYEAFKNLVCWCHRYSKFHSKPQEYLNKVIELMRFSRENLLSLAGDEVPSSLELSSINVKNGYYIDQHGVNVFERLESKDLSQRELTMVYCHWLRLSTFFDKFYTI
ncbi:hypothetical protein WICPIJ_009821 [Wickerhamomyces pijperi]|uniref:Uncharacterized protein n=1 Tax=Wickerhamomyces pijperi TaxID=599730 RepID=A0A9P8PJR7_WICPI|nr:hypothetical protein WICPIJ_009821 [Wickerhamomyces pijperi]